MAGCMHKMIPVCGMTSMELEQLHLLATDELNQGCTYTHKTQ